MVILSFKEAAEIIVKEARNPGMWEHYQSIQKKDIPDLIREVRVGLMSPHDAILKYSTK